MKEFLKKHTDNAKKIAENPQEHDSLKTLPKRALRQAKANLTESKVSFELLLHQVLESVKEEAICEEQDKERIQDLLDEESEEGFSIIAEAQELIYALTVLKEEIDSEHEIDAQLRKELQERDNRLRKEELERDAELRKEELERKNVHLRKEEVDRNDRIHQEEEDRQLKARQSDRDSQTQREENERKFALEQMR